MGGCVQAQVGLFCGQEVGNETSYASSGATSDLTTSTSLFVKGVATNGSPPWREDNKDGHYMFAIGENLTSRCNYAYQLYLLNRYWFL